MIKRTMLTKEEVKLICSVTHKTKIDTWFYLLGDLTNGYVVEDLENRKIISVPKALEEAKDGFIELESLGFTNEDINQINNIVKKFTK